MKTIRFFCNKVNKEVVVVFNSVPCPTTNNPNNKIIGLAQSCSGTKTICQNCKDITFLLHELNK